MHVVSISIIGFRSFSNALIEPQATGTTVITGRNGTGKSSILEAIGYLSTLQSFRGGTKESMIRTGGSSAVLRAVTVAGDRTIDIEAELTTVGRSRTMVNRQMVRKRTDLHDVLRTTIFSPEDIGVVRGGPSERRRFLDDTLATIDPRSASLIDEVEKILRQRTALVRRPGGGPDLSVASTLDVWDSRFHHKGSLLVQARENLTTQLVPLVNSHYERLAGTSVPITLTYRRSWEGDLLKALEHSRREDMVRGVTSVGPHRDDLDLTLGGLPSRSHASQGEQRSLALAIRLAAHQLATDRLGLAPVLLLDDVFSELDPYRARALLAGLPPGQSLLTTALPPPPEIDPVAVYTVEPVGIVSRDPAHGAVR